MITENMHRDNKRTHGGLMNDVQQNKGLYDEYEQRGNNDEIKQEVTRPVDNGGVKSTNFEPRLEEQWHAVRDEYLSHYPDLQQVETDYKDGRFGSMIDRLAEHKQTTPMKIQEEILNWTSK